MRVNDESEMRFPVMLRKSSGIRNGNGEIEDAQGIKMRVELRKFLETSPAYFLARLLPRLIPIGRL
jgi:hypothetical protein